MSELAIPLIDCWKFMRFFLSIAEKLSILVGIHLYIIIHKGSFTFRCQCFSLTMSELSPKLSLSSAKHTRINYPTINKTTTDHPSTTLTSRPIGATTAFHQAPQRIPCHQGPIEYPWVRGGDDSGRYYRRRPLTLHRWWWWFMSADLFIVPAKKNLSSQPKKIVKYLPILLLLWQ